MTFAEGSCAKLPFGDGTFDVVVSFETIEHILEQNEFLDEIKRVLKPAGLLIMSSPNRAQYSDARGYSNEFHVKELYRAEFSELLNARFQHISWFSQRNAFVSLLVPEAIDKSHTIGETLTISKAKPDALQAALPALYFLVFATNDSAAVGQLTPRLSVFSDSEEWAYSDYRKIYQASQTFWKREAELVARCAELEKQNAALALNAAPAPAATTPSFLGRVLKRLVS